MRRCVLSYAARLDIFHGKGEPCALMYSKRYKGMFLSILGIAALYAVSFYYGKLMQNAIGIKKVRFSDDIVQAAKTHGVHPALITAVIHAESNFDPKARSYRGAKGLMQINPPTQRYLKLKNAYDPSQNIMAGAKYLKELITLFKGNTKLALAAYNAGPGAVRRFKGIPPYNETRKYVKKVLVYFDQYRKTFLSSSLMS